MHVFGTWLAVIAALAIALPCLHDSVVVSLDDINLFTFFFEQTMLVHLFKFTPAARAPFENYARALGVPLKRHLLVPKREPHQLERADVEAARVPL